MTLPASGPISLLDVNVELGYSSTATISLNDTAVRTLFGVASGQISMSDGYGKSNNTYWIIFRGTTSGTSYTGDSEAIHAVNPTNGVAYHFYKQSVSGSLRTAAWITNSDGTNLTTSYYDSAHTSWGGATGGYGVGTNYHPSCIPMFTSKGTNAALFTTNAVGTQFSPVRSNTGVNYYTCGCADSSSNSAFFGTNTDVKSGYYYVGVSFVTSGGTVTNYAYNNPYGNSTSPGARIVAMTTDGNTYYMGGGNNKIIKIVKGTPATVASFTVGETNIGGLCADSSNNFYTLGYSSNVLRKYDSSFVNTLTKTVGGSYTPTGNNTLYAYGNYVYAFGQTGPTYVVLAAFNQSDLSVSWSKRISASSSSGTYPTATFTATSKGLYGSIQIFLNKISRAYYDFKFPLNGNVTNAVSSGGRTFTPSANTITVTSGSTSANTTLKTTTNMSSPGYTVSPCTFVASTVPAPYVSSQWT